MFTPQIVKYTCSLTVTSGINEFKDKPKKKKMIESMIMSSKSQI